MFCYTEFGLFLRAPAVWTPRLAGMSSQTQRNRGSYLSLTIKRKLEIISAVEKAPASKKKKEIAAEFGIPPSTLSSIKFS